VFVSVAVDVLSMTKVAVDVPVDDWVTVGVDVSVGVVDAVVEGVAAPV
jgi:hypothetical protein